MSNTQLLEKIDAAIAEKNLLKHPFYQDWQAGKLSRESLQLYAAQYYRHVEAFPRHLRVLAARADESLKAARGSGRCATPGLTSARRVPRCPPGRGTPLNRTRLARVPGDARDEKSRLAESNRSQVARRHASIPCETSRRELGGS